MVGPSGFNVVNGPFPWRSTSLIPYTTVISTLFLGHAINVTDKLFAKRFIHMALGE